MNFNELLYRCHALNGNLLRRINLPGLYTVNTSLNYMWKIFTFPIVHYLGILSHSLKIQDFHVKLNNDWEKRSCLLSKFHQNLVLYYVLFHNYRYFIKQFIPMGGGGNTCTEYYIEVQNCVSNCWRLVMEKIITNETET